MYTYFTKEEVESRLSKAEYCGKVMVDLKRGDSGILVRCGNYGAFERRSADEVARSITSNDAAYAVVDCDEGIMVFNSEDERDRYMGGRL